MRIFTIGFFILLTMSLLQAQDIHHKHSIGLGAGPAYLSEKQTFFPAVHIEYEYCFEVKQRELHAGISLEKIFTKGKHYAFGIGLGTSLWKGLEFSIGPGIVLEDDGLSPFGHISLGYKFEFGHMSIGPCIEYAGNGHHFHFFSGISMGIGF